MIYTQKVQKANAPFHLIQGERPNQNPQGKLFAVK